MRSKNVLFCLLVCVLLTFPACKSQKTDVTPAGNAVLAKVNGVAITEDDLYLRLEGGHGGTITPEMRKQALENLINQELLYQEGLKLGLDKDAKYRNAVKVMEMRLKDFKRSEMSRRVGSTRIAATVNVTEQDVDRYIEENGERLKSEFHVGMVRFTDEAEAKEARARIQGGETFESVAGKKSSHAPSGAKQQWDLGYLPWNQLPFEWRQVLEVLGKGAVSDVLSGKRTGVTLIKLYDKKKNSKLDPQSIRGAIMNRLLDEKVVEAYNEHLQKLKQEATITRSDERR
jgi:parvulin-like peptidyl-prolyl isomerase